MRPGVANQPINMLPDIHKLTLGLLWRNSRCATNELVCGLYRPNRHGWERGGTRIVEGGGLIKITLNLRL